MDVSVGIAAYNAERNISSLINSVLKQKELNYKLKKVYIYSDGSSDSTLEKISTLNDPRVAAINGKKRQGFAHAFKVLLESNDSELFVTLNDDVILDELTFISELTKLYNSNKNIGLISSYIKPLPPKGFIEKAIASGFVAYSKMASHYKNGNNIFTCDGKSLIMSDNFIKSIVYPKNKSLIGNVDAFIYLLCKTNGFDYRQSKKTMLYFKLPSNIKDFVKWQSRNLNNPDLLKVEFKELVKEEYKMPLYLFTYYRLIEFLKNPLGSLFIFFVGIYCKFTRVISSNSQTWDVIKSTKNIDNYA